MKPTVESHSGNRSSRNAIVYNPNTSNDLLPPFSMITFLRLLQKRYSSALTASGDRDSALQATLSPLLQSLALAEASLMRESTGLVGDAEPLHVGVFGPTQSGKSSVINWISGLQLATPSPLAGFTVHPQGFSAPRSPGWLERLGRYFEGYQQLPSRSLRPDQLQAFGFDVIETSSIHPHLSGSVLWDTPDFDSVSAHRYEASVLRIAALMDVVIIVVSKDKYGDLSVWEFIRLIAPLAQPTLLVINKTDSESEAALKESVARKWASFRDDPLPEIVTLPYLRENDLESARASISDRLTAHLPDLKARTRRDGASKRLVDCHWDAWIHPIVDENRRTALWQERLENLVSECLERYQRDYLNHPNHYETFQRALAELLTLLEVPGIGAALHTARRVVTWPMRQLTRLGRSASGRDQNSDGIERAVLHQIAQHALIQLSEEMLLEIPGDFTAERWKNGLSQQLSTQRANILGQFDMASATYVAAFRPEIESTARGLYAHLQEHPLVLNSLRATRVTTDAAALGVALHTGGIGIQDFVIAPAILSMTSMMAEGALGHFMSRSQEQLKRKQLDAIEALIRSALISPLALLPTAIDSSLRIGITVDQLETASSLRSSR